MGVINVRRNTVAKGNYLKGDDGKSYLDNGDGTVRKTPQQIEYEKEQQYKAERDAENEQKFNAYKAQRDAERAIEKMNETSIFDDMVGFGKLMMPFAKIGIVLFIVAVIYAILAGAFFELVKSMDSFELLWNDIGKCLYAHNYFLAAIIGWTIVPRALVLIRAIVYTWKNIKIPFKDIVACNSVIAILSFIIKALVGKLGFIRTKYPSALTYWKFDTVKNAFKFDFIQLARFSVCMAVICLIVLVIASVFSKASNK